MTFDDQKGITPDKLPLLNVMSRDEAVEIIKDVQFGRIWIPFCIEVEQEPEPH